MLQNEPKQAKKKKKSTNVMWFWDGLWYQDILRFQQKLKKLHIFSDTLFYSFKLFLMRT